MDHSLSRNNHMICPLAGFKIIFPIVYPAPMGDPARSSASRAARISSSVIRFAGRSAPFPCFGLCCKLSFNLFNFGGDKAHPAKERQASRDLE